MNEFNLRQRATRAQIDSLIRQTEGPATDVQLAAKTIALALPTTERV